MQSSTIYQPRKEEPSYVAFITKTFAPHTSIAPILLEKIALVGCYFDLNNFQPHLFATYKIDPPKTIQNSVFKRQAEYLAGRKMAQTALEKFNITNVNISIGKHRCPQWPKGINAAISHSSNTAVCIAAKDIDHQYVGIDVEPIISNSTMKKISKSIINTNEKALLMKHSLHENVAFTIIFSAKESLFKALYPSVGHYFEFDVADTLHICTKTNQIIIKLTVDLSPNLQKGRLFKGYFTINNHSVTTYIV